MDVAKPDAISSGVDDKLPGDLPKLLDEAVGLPYGYNVLIMMNRYVHRSSQDVALEYERMGEEAFRG